MTKNILFKWIDPKALKPNRRNVRVHTEAHVAQLVKSLDQWGWTKPVLVNEKYSILAGHGIWLAAKQRGDERVPVVIKHGLTPKQERAYLIADNKLAMNSEWDDALLTEELRALSKEDFDLLTIGFSRSEIEKMLSEEGEGEGEFQEADESIATEHKCPKCGYKWSGKSNAEE